jgi:hypothetical protein
MSCEWVGDNRDGALETTCGHVFELNHGTPRENGMKFCCYCGKPLTYVPAANDYDERDANDEIAQQMLDEGER